MHRGQWQTLGAGERGDVEGEHGLSKGGHEGTRVTVAGGECESHMSRRVFVASGLCALASSTLLGCGFGTAAAPPSDPRLTARPGSPTVTPTLGPSELGLGDSRDGLLYVAWSCGPDVPEWRLGEWAVQRSPCGGLR